MGDWLAVNGEAIFGTRPWVTAEGNSPEGIEVRFTQKENALYAILMDTPPGPLVTIKGLHGEADMMVTALGEETPITWQQVGKDITFRLPTLLTSTPAAAFKLSPPPRWAV